MLINNSNIQPLKKFILLCLVTCLLLYSGIQIFEIEDLKIKIAQHKELNAEEMKVEKSLQHLIELEVEKEIVRPSQILRNITIPIYQPNVSAEFPHKVNGTARIPHIIHQIGDTESLPDNFLLSMRSFIEHNPTWEYRYWTYESGYNFLKKFHPYLVDIYVKFGEKDVKKSDLLRFAVIYEYGGLYADLDVSNVRSLNITTTKYACIIPTEPFEHAAVLYRKPFLLTTSIFLCRPKHPFVEKVLLRFQQADPKGHPVSTTGPSFITNMFIQYNNISWSNIPASRLNYKRSNSPYFYKGTRDEESDDGIYIPNSQYFGDNIDPFWINANGSLNECLVKDLFSASIFIQRACKEFESRKVVRKEKQYTFAIHHWFHWWTKGKEYNDFLQQYNIRDVIPKVITFEESHSNQINK